jgi:hypothetical protein
MMKLYSYTLCIVVFVLGLLGCIFGRLAYKGLVLDGYIARVIGILLLIISAAGFMGTIKKRPRDTDKTGGGGVQG